MAEFLSPQAGDVELAATEIFDPLTRSSMLTAELNVARKRQAAVNRPRFARYLSAIENGLRRGFYEQQKISGRKWVTGRKH